MLGKILVLNCEFYTNNPPVVVVGGQFRVRASPLCIDVVACNFGFFCVALTNTFVVVLFSHVLATQVIDCKWKKVLRCRKAKFASIKAKKESLFFGAAADQEFLVLNL